MSDVKKCPEGMVYIPEGTFRMGSTNGRHDELPVRDVYVSGFCMDKHEVTNAEYSSYQESPSPRGFDGTNQPVVKVNWYEADAFCRAQGKRLPTEAEWEKAARGPYDCEYGTMSGDLNRSEAHYNEDYTADACSYPENDYGLCDMTGNVWEWVSNWFDADAYSYVSDTDPQGPSLAEYRLEHVHRYLQRCPQCWEYPTFPHFEPNAKALRGGGLHLHEYERWFGESRGVYERVDLRAAYRRAEGPNDGDLDIGFRCAADPLESEE